MSYAPSAAAARKIDETVALYPDRASALLPVLHILQDEAGFISPEAEVWVGAKLEIPPIRVREVLSFYTMLRRRPAGRTTLLVCQNLSCTLAGAEDILGFLKETLGVGIGETTTDGRFTLAAVECLGNCDRAPCLQVDGVDYGPVRRDIVASILEELRARD